MGTRKKCCLCLGSRLVLARLKELDALFSRPRSLLCPTSRAANFWAQRGVPGPDVPAEEDEDEIPPGNNEEDEGHREVDE